MREQLGQRIKTLKAEFENGQKMLGDLEAREAELKQTMLRISGAIQVLEEMLTEEETQGGKGQMTRAKGNKTAQVAEVA